MAGAGGVGNRATGLILKFSGVLLVGASWISAAIFGVYILAFYLGAVPRGLIGQWNSTLPKLYEANTPAATLAIGAHLATGAILLLFGPIQLLGAVRNRFKTFHRWVGTIYVLAAMIAGLGGLGFILVKGTIGGMPMNIGFGLYGALMVLCAVMTYINGRGRREDSHRAWAIRLFALAIGSWLYRMDYGFWLLLSGGAGHVQDFTGPFDVVMAYAFYIPNLIVAEAFIRARRDPAHPLLQLLASLLLLAATALVAIGTYYFVLYYWGPGILKTLG